MREEEKYLYGGLSGIELDNNSFDLGGGVLLNRTYAHLMSPCLMAFSPPGPEGYHPAPWKAAEGGFGFDIEVELKVPKASALSDNLNSQEVIWWIAALLRIVHVPFLTVPVISDHSFETARDSETKPVIEPFEIEPRILAPAENSQRVISLDALDWVKAKWMEGGRLLISNPSFYSALKAFDAATVRGKTSSSLLALWGGLEQIFSPSPGELRFRVASTLAAYLEPQGESRLDLYKRVLKLYNERSVAAHTAKEMETGPLVETYVLMRNALVRMIDENVVPTQQDLEARLFGCV